MLKAHVLPALQRKRVMDRIIFQQDGAPAHIHKDVKAFLLQNFGEKVVSRHFEFSWPARSPDLTPMDFFFWGYIMSLVYAQKIETIDHLKHSIRDVIRNIPLNMLTKTVQNIPKRLEAVVAHKGKHIEHLL